MLYIPKLTVGFETTIKNKSDPKVSRYSSLLKDPSSSSRKMAFINLSIGAVVSMGSSCYSLSPLLRDES